MNVRIFMVDDETDLVWTVSQHIRRERADWTLTGFSNPVEALEAINKNPPDLLITDLRMPALDGLELALLARQRVRDLRVILISAYGSSAVMQNAERLGRVVFIEKPFDYRELIQRIDRWLAEDSRFSGEIDLPLLSDLIQIVALSKETGSLSVSHRGLRGQVWFTEGRIEHCTTPDLVGTEAFRELMSWTGGEFRLQPGETAPTCSIEGPTDKLLLDSFRRIDEAGVSAAGYAPPAAADPPTILGRTKVLWQQRQQTLNLPTTSTVLAVSLADGKSLALHGPHQDRGSVDGQKSLRELVEIASSLDAESPSGTIEAFEPGFGWIAAWHRDHGLGVVYARPLSGTSGRVGLQQQGSAIMQALEISSDA